MKKFFILLSIAFTLTSCSVKEKPEFVSVNNVKVLETTSQFITLQANAIFKNPNHVGGNLKADDIKIIVNGSEVATVSSESFKVPVDDEFTVPLTAKIETKKLISDKNLSSLLGSLLGQKLNVQYKGVITYKLLGISYDYDVDYAKDVKIKF